MRKTKLITKENKKGVTKMAKYTYELLDLTTLVISQVFCCCFYLVINILFSFEELCVLYGYSKTLE